MKQAKNIVNALIILSSVLLRFSSSFSGLFLNLSLKSKPSFINILTQWKVIDKNMKKFLHILFFEIFVLSAEAVHPCLTFYYTPLASIPQYWYYKCRDYASLHPHLVFFFFFATKRKRILDKKKKHANCLICTKFNPKRLNHYV